MKPNLMNKQQIDFLVNEMKKAGIKFGDGLTDKEVELIENKFNFQFPPDLKVFLQNKLPFCEGFVNWRWALHSKTQYNLVVERINWTLDGMLFDVEHGKWYENFWGEQPKTLEEKIAKVTDLYKTYPKLIPIFSHRYIPSTPNKVGNPVFSVHQTDIVYYGNDLASYFSNEFYFELDDKLFNRPKKPNRTIAFWGELVQYLDDEFAKGLAKYEEKYGKQ